MSPITWTPTALASEARPWHGRAWRVVEDQRVASTMKLVDTAAEQVVLEALLDAAKPPLPAAAKPLHYLLSTPFRYPPLPGGSRFRAGGEPGVFYGADALPTACAELGYWRWRFLRDATAMSRLPPVVHTAFQASLRATAIDTREPPLARDAAKWTNPDDYRDCQALARAARNAEIGAIRYASVRHPDHGGCVALLTPAGFVGRKPVGESKRLWLSVQPAQVTWQVDQTLLEFRYG